MLVYTTEGLHAQIHAAIDALLEGVVLDDGRLRPALEPQRVPPEAGPREEERPPPVRLVILAPSCWGSAALLFA